MKKLFLSSLILSLPIFIFGQSYIETKWEKFFGGSYDDKAKSVVSTETGFVFAGWTRSNGNGGKDLMVVNTDKDGNKIWEKYYGTTEDDSANVIISNGKDGYVLGGVTTLKETGYTYLWFLGLDKDGVKKWERNQGGGSLDCATGIFSTKDGGFLILGALEAKGDHDRDMVAIKVDNKGNKSWHATYGGRYYDDMAYSAVPTNDEGFILVGYTKCKGAGEEDVYVVKIDKYGTMKWEKTFGGAGADIAYSIAPTSDGRYYICGSTRSKGFGEEDMYVLKIDNTGNLEWEKTFGGAASDIANSVVCTSDKGCVVSGYTKSKGNGKLNSYLIKLDNKGEICWERSFGKKSFDAFESIILLPDNGYLVAGWSESSAGGESDMWAIRISDNTEPVIKTYVEKKLSEWEKKGPGESDQDFASRISPSNKENKITELRKEAMNFYSNEDGSLAQNTAVTNNNEDEPMYRGGGDPLSGLNAKNNAANKQPIQIGNYYALIIGIDNYSGEWPKLKNAVNDAKAIENLLRTKYRFNSFHVLYNEQASRDAIIKEFEWLVKNAKVNDNVLIYYSGHGEYKQELNKGYWVPADATTASISNYVSNNDIQTFLGGIKSKHTLLIADACFSGDIFRGKTVTIPYEASDKYYEKVYNLPSRKAISSGGIEPVMDGGKDGHSVFAYYLLKTLNTNTSKYYDASQLYENIKIPIVNNSEQTPIFNPIKDSGDEGGQFLFILK
jgi:hypothetical protein